MSGQADQLADGQESRHAAVDDMLMVASAPLRLALGGGGTDLPFYCEQFGGDIITVAISLWVRVVGHRGTLDHQYRYSHESTEIRDSPDEIEQPYVREAFRMVGPADPCEITSLGRVPAGTGLGSSGAFSLSLLAVLNTLAGRPLARTALIEQAYELEAVRLGRPIGKQDHYACGLGGLRRLIIDRAGKVTVEPVRMPPGAAESLDDRLLLFYTGRRRDSASQLWPSTATEQLSRRVEQLHYIRELGDKTRTALQTGHIDEIPALMREHWRVKRERESTTLWDNLVGLARRHGARAGKLVGAGGGGFVLLFVEPREQAAVIEVLERAGTKHVPFCFMDRGVTMTLLSATGEKIGEWFLC